MSRTPQPQPQSHPHLPPLTTTAHLPYCNPRCYRNLLLVACHYHPYRCCQLSAHRSSPALISRPRLPSLPAAANRRPHAPLQCPSVARRSQPRPPLLPGRSQPHPFLSHLSSANPPDLAAICRPALGRAQPAPLFLP
ncbi:hypothetical protein GW17_00026731 [Ensete ventricosum]|nr:hypothetical protein GW17_00026731 [Ensete ventricosum]